MYENLTAPSTGEQLTLFPEVSPANHLARRAKGKEKMIQDTFGLRCLESFRKSSRFTSWAKMFADCLVGQGEWYSTISSLIWNLRATKSSRVYFLLRVVTPRTSGSESGLLPTVTTSRGDRYSNGSLKLQGAVKLLPTPTRPRPHDTDLTVGVYYPTQRQMSLEKAIALLPTPTKPDGQNSSLPISQKKRDSIPGALLTAGMGGQLNPPFVEWMTGYPIGWTELPPSETP